MHIDIYYSYACRDSYLVYAWLKMIQRCGPSLEIDWRPFAIQMDDPNDYWTRSWATVNSELRGFIAAEAARRQGVGAFYRFHDALEQAVHEQFLELGDETTLLAAARQAGLDFDRFRADWLEPNLIKVIQRSHWHAAEQWNVSGTPTLVFSNGRSFHLELNQIPSEADALETFRATEALALKLPYLRQLRQTV